MSIEAMKLALEALEGINDEDRDKDFLDLKQFVRLDRAIEALRTAIQQAEAQQPATGEPVAALVRSRRIRTPAHCAFDKKDHYSEWSDWEPCTLSYARAVTDPARDRGLLPLYEMLPLYTHPAPSVPATTEPVVDVRCEGCGYMTHHREHMGCVRAAKQHTRPAPSGLGDSKRLDYLQDRGATIDLIAGVAAFYPMRFRVGGLHSSANIDVLAAKDSK